MYCLFVIDVAKFQKGGQLEEVVYVSTARIVTAYIPLQQDLKEPDANGIIIKIRDAARLAEIDHPDASVIPGAPRWLSTLRFFSKAIEDAFISDNSQHPASSASNSQQFDGMHSKLDSLQHEVKLMKERFNARGEDKESIALLQESNRILSAQTTIKDKQCATKDIQCAAKDREIAKLKRLGVQQVRASLLSILL